MKTPILDHRSKPELMAQFARMAAEYVPEWHYTGDPTDPGAALAELFGEMFSQTIDRFNAVPGKLYTEFLDLLGVKLPAVTSAEGLVQFFVHEGVEETVPVPAGSMLFALDESGDHIVYETERPISATPARLEAVYYADGEAGLIQQLDLTTEQPFFAPTGGENLQCHRFSFTQNDVLALKGPCEIEVWLKSHARILEEGIAKRLADPAFATWTWPGEQGPMPFDSVRCEGDRLILLKNNPGALRPDEEGRLSLFCDMAAGAGSIEIDGVRLRSTPLAPLPADYLAHNDIPIEQGEGGYCFGRTPAPYEMFYIRSDPAFSKRGADVHLRMDIRSIVYTEVDGKPQYVFDRRIIDKNDAVVIRPDDVFVREVVWEYYNGKGWTDLVVEGNRNPFSGKEEGPLELRFTVPEDLCPTLVNAREGIFIRARVVGVENSFTAVPRWILPFVRSIDCRWSYPDGRPAERIWAANNAGEQALEGTAGVTELRFEIYADMAERQRAMYFCFDRPLEGLPVSMMFEMRGRTGGGKLLFEVWDGERFRQIRALDTTDALARSGPVYLYLTEPAAEGCFFGRTGSWLRMSQNGTPRGDRNPPVVGEIRFNVVRAVQRRRAPEQRFTTEGYEVGKTVRLLDPPIMWCDVWVDEAGSITAAELEQIATADQRLTREGSSIESCLIRWKQVPSLAQSGPNDRVFELDSHTGTIRFGDGKAGRVPPAGFENIRVQSACGGGSRGNREKGAVSEFLVSVPRIAALENITPMGGGTDRMDRERIERLGNRRLRHRGRAVGVRDYEELVMEHFGQVADVKCFPGIDENGNPQPGHLCVVVLGTGLEAERTERSLCEQVYEFLAERGDCVMVAAGRLHVRPATETVVNIDLTVTLKDLDYAAETHQELQNLLTELIDRRWRSREIGQQIRLDELYTAVKATANVSAIRRVMVEGIWYENGRRRVTPIETGTHIPFATVRSGAHMVRIQ
ncbi:MAG: baseplate J/gp47 family protein [Clostridia bacterium]|nr:baseplate J/gp47 family protein [Clostridia bacterium]